MRSRGSAAALESQLPPGLVDGDGGAVGQVQTAQAGPHGQPDLFGYVRASHDVHGVGDVAGFGSEQEDVVGPVVDFGVELVGVGGEGDDPAVGHGADQVVEVRVEDHVGHVVVVQAGPAQFGVFEVEAQGFYQVQDGAGHGAQADGGAGVAGDPRRVVAQVGGGGFHPAGLIGLHHGVHYGDGVAVGVGDQLVGTIVRFAVSVLVHAVNGL